MMQIQQKHNVILSGGGMKGAYQYGFFKRLYKLVPDFQINKVYAVSVGSLNAIPIVTGHMDMLDQYWARADILPFDTIVQDWHKIKSTNTYYKNMHRMRSLVQHGSIFHSLDTKPFVQMFEKLTPVELRKVRHSLLILSWDMRAEKVVINRCTSMTKTVAAIKSSSMFPGLFNIESHVIDGANIDLGKIIPESPRDPWIYIDLQGKLYGCSKQRNKHKHVNVFSPTIVSSPTMNVVSCLLVNRAMIDDLIDNGAKDADKYVARLD